MKKINVEDKLKELGIKLPEVPIPVGSYIPAKISGNLAFTSGQSAKINGVRHYVGKVGKEITIKEGYLAAYEATLNCLVALKQAIGSLDKITNIVKVVGFVNSASGFNRQPDVINGCSDLLLKLYGKNGKHARSAVGVAELPYNISVEIEMIVEIERN